jgi:Cys-rich repeat protein
VQLLGRCSADSQCASGLVCFNGKCRGKFIAEGSFLDIYSILSILLKLAQVGEVCGGNADCVSLKCFSGKCQSTSSYF